MDNTRLDNGFHIHFRQIFAKETFSNNKQLKSYENKYGKPEMCERKKTGVHGTLGMMSMAWKFNSKQLLYKTLNSGINIIETRAVLNLVQKVGKCAPEAKIGRT